MPLTMFHDCNRVALALTTRRARENLLFLQWARAASPAARGGSCTERPPLSRRGGRQAAQTLDCPGGTLVKAARL